MFRHSVWVIIIALITTALEHCTFVWITRIISVKLISRMF